MIYIYIYTYACHMKLFSPNVFTIRLNEAFFHRLPLKRAAKDGNNVSAKLGAAYQEFREHCKILRESPLVKRFTRDNLGWGSIKTYPKCSFKGSDTRLILGFLIRTLEKPEVQLDEVTSIAYIAAKSMDDFLRLVFGTKDGQGCRKPLFNRNEGAHALALLTVWSEKFYTCASLCFGKRICFFPLTPKFHFLLHVAADLKEQLSSMQSTDRYILNPGLFATQMAEDATGRSCRMARSVHVRTASVRVAQKWLIAIKLFWDEQAQEQNGAWCWLRRLRKISVLAWQRSNPGVSDPGVPRKGGRTSLIICVQSFPFIGLRM